jgi:hypothetical protein
MFKLGMVGALALAGAFVMSAPASAVTFQLNIISAGNIGTGTQGTVTLTQNGLNEVDVEVKLTAGVLLINTGGPHTPFAFNLAPAKAAATVTVTSVNTPATFFAQAGPQSATPYGNFTNAIGYNGSNGGVGHGSAGPLDFKVVFAGGLSISDFVKNGVNGYFFAADLYGTGGNTGSVASNQVCTTCPDNAPPPDGTPIPGTVGLMGSVLAMGAGFGAWRRRRRAQTVA